jgi:hypothetical protein
MYTEIERLREKEALPPLKNQIRRQQKSLGLYNKFLNGLGLRFIIKEGYYTCITSILARANSTSAEFFLLTALSLQKGRGLVK